MEVYRYSGIATSLAGEVRVSHRSPQYGHPAHRELATGYGPCRHCLKTFAIGVEDRLLFTYQPFEEPGSLPAPGPVFVHADACDRYVATALPEDFRSLPLVVEGYAMGGRLLIQERVTDQVPERQVARAFELSEVAYVHLRNGEAGCFMARVDRVPAEARAK